ncbi:unnamed protein product [Urochloa humidicola]
MAATKIHRRHHHISLLLDAAATTTSPSSSTKTPPPPHPHLRLPGQIWHVEAVASCDRVATRVSLGGTGSSSPRRFCSLDDVMRPPSPVRAKPSTTPSLTATTLVTMTSTCFLRPRAPHLLPPFIAARTWGPCRDIRGPSAH